MRQRSIVVNCLVVWLASVANAQWTKQNLAECRSVDIIQNSDYGFQVRIPAGLRGCSSSPLSDHGVIVPIIEHSPQGWIELYAGYNALFHRTANETADFQIESLKDSDAVPDSARTVSRRSVRLGTLNAVRYVVRYKTKGPAVDMVRDSIVALRPVIRNYSAPSHEYSVDLVTPAQFYESDRKLFNAMIKTWQIKPTPDDPVR